MRCSFGELVARTPSIVVGTAHGPDATLNRHLALDALARAVPIATVVAVLAERGATERRTRTPPGLITIFFCIAMDLHAGDCRTHVFRQLALGSCSSSKRYCR